MKHPYTCYKEILTQRGAWEETVEVVLSHSSQIRSFFQAAQPGQVIFAGCTSPLYAGNAAAVYWQSALGIPCRAVPCSELVQFPSAYYADQPGKPILVVLSRSGKTTETLWAVQEFERRYPGRILYIGCTPGSELEKLAHLSLLIPKGAEETLPQTRSFSAMYLAALLSGALVSQQDEIMEMLKHAPQLVEPVIRSTEPIIARLFEKRVLRNIFYLGSGPLFGIAQEAALKMMEMSISETMCFSFLESRHGPKSLINDQSLVVGLYSHAGLNLEAQLMEELTLKHLAMTVALLPDPGWTSGQVTHKLPVNSSWPDSILGLSYLPAIQLLGYYRALANGVDPDTPRNLTAYIEIAAAS